MKLVVRNNAVILSETDNFRDLSAEPALSARIEGLGGHLDPDGSHLWIPACYLRKLAVDQPTKWHRSFDAMLSKAAAFGWVEDEQVRVHFETDR